MRNQLTLVFTWLLIVKLRFATADLSYNATTHLLLERMLRGADLTHNFLVAPHEIQTLLETLLHDGKIETSRENDAQPNVVESYYEQYFTPIINPIIVSNKLHVDDAAKNSKDEVASKQTPLESHNHTVLNNAVAISARWSINFQKRDTQKRQFHMSQAWQDAVYTDVMRKDDIFQYAKLEELNARALELPLQRNALKMLILLPDEESGLTPLAQQLCRNLSLVEEIVAKHLRPELVRVFIPKFKITHQIDMKDIFSEYANSTTTSMEHMQLFNEITKITHEAHISVSEQGIGDMTRTTVLFWNAFSSVRTTPIKFNIDHPFIFLIRNDQGIQFYGHLARV